MDLTNQTTTGWQKFMSFIGNIAAAQSAKAIGKYNEGLAYQQAAYERKKAAVREISEETGLNKEKLKIISKLAVTNSDKFFRKFKKEIVWFEVRYDGELHDKLMPDFNEGIDKCMWLNINSKKILDFNFKKRVFELLMIKNNHKNVIKTDLQESFF